MPRWSQDTPYRRGRSVVCALRVHLVFVTKYRRGAIGDADVTVLGDAFRVACAKARCRMESFDAADDHVHLLVEHPATVAVATLVNVLKGVSARRLRQQPGRRSACCRTHLWSPSYFAASCGGAPLETIAAYVESQRGKHRIGNPHGRPGALAGSASTRA